jgi:hypothetical protein
MTTRATYVLTLMFVVASRHIIQGQDVVGGSCVFLSNGGLANGNKGFTNIGAFFFYCPALLVDVAQPADTNLFALSRRPPSG